MSFEDATAKPDKFRNFFDDDFVSLLDDQIKKADAKHGDWSNYNHIQMFDKLADETEEVYEAICESDVEGEHGMKAELIQVACTAYKMWRALA